MTDTYKKAIIRNDPLADIDCYIITRNLYKYI